MTCPCGSAQPYDDCCGPLHRGEAKAETPERLMRSRYSAFAVGDAAYLLRTWHLATRPERLELEPGVRWTGLTIVRAEGRIVEFLARSSQGEQHEVSRFARQDGDWVYVEGV
ncbi:YchJ family metal-binding protein [Nonomuraea sp. NBC_01738]|uniref:YchJ family protein n=1 Tax=Nonomuraea sp. NBC_01738 TaxID=2976003 RepID=UPI002E12F053|nr:YchJ family metal-binding protein [Nonomuraea sp. NBC_01738]